MPQPIEVARAVNFLFDNYGPGLEKSAEEQFMDRLTRGAEDDEVLSPKFVKVAGMQGIHPWDLACRIALSYENLEKSAAAGMPLARYYVEWGDEMVKRAGLLGKAWSGVKSVFKRGPKKTTPGGPQMAGADDWAKTQKNLEAFQKSRSKTTTGAPGVDVAKVNQEKGFRSVRDIKAQKSAPAGQGQAPSGGQAPAGDAKPFNWKNLGYGALGTAAVGGTGYLGYKGYQAMKGQPQQPQAAYYRGY